MIKFIITRGIGLSPGKVGWIVTAGFSQAEPAPSTGEAITPAIGQSISIGVAI